MIKDFSELFTDTPPMLILRSESQSQFEKLWRANANLLSSINSGEKAIETDLKSGSLTGIRAYSTSASREVVFTQPVDVGTEINWREGLLCSLTGLNNRCRSALDLLLRVCNLSPASRIYISELTTPTYHWIRRGYPNVVGSEYLGQGIQGGSSINGLRHEDMTNLSFENDSFDIVVSFDVLEHVPDYKKALKEIARVTAPGGTALMTFPFNGQHDTLVRASFDAQGQLVHHETPEYHGDPVGNGHGILCFYHFGHDILDELRNAGWHDASIIWLWSAAAANLGGLQPYIHARKRA